MIFFIISLVAFTFLFGFWIWVQWKWSKLFPKAKFALLSMGSIISCLTVGLSFLSGGMDFLWLVSEYFFETKAIPVPDIFISLAVIGLTFLSIYLIYRISENTAKRWQAPMRVSESNLVENEKQDDLMLLAWEQCKLIFNRQADQMASEYAVNWQQSAPQPPSPVEERILLRDLFYAYYGTVNIPDDGWNGHNKYWIGEALSVNLTRKKPLILLILDQSYKKDDVIKKIDQIILSFGYGENIQIFAVYTSTQNIGPEIIKHKGYSVEILNSYYMIYDSLDLRGYATKLFNQYYGSQIGATNLTLNDSYVELNVEMKGQEGKSGLHQILDDWGNEKSNRHIAITGEYGQGKSTAMLKYCCQWAQDYLNNKSDQAKIPLLIELRGKSPSEMGSLDFIGAWAGHYGLRSDMVMHLIQNGLAIVIFEGFDELKKSGRKYDRHEHFNALWAFAFPNTKLLFTGRPNFFIDEGEVNKTLRAEGVCGTAGEAYCQVYKLCRMDGQQIINLCRKLEDRIKDGIITAMRKDERFFDIISRPSMFPVVASIWDEIISLQEEGNELTGALLIEKYLEATYHRKIAEMDNDRNNLPTGQNYFILPASVLKLLTICVAWRMSGLDAKNTISRKEIKRMVSELLPALLDLGKTSGVSEAITNGLKHFEESYGNDENKIVHMKEDITTMICSAGILVPDPVGGESNLKFPHKQFYEYLICKGFCIHSHYKNTAMANFILQASKEKGLAKRCVQEPSIFNYLAECIGQDLQKFISPLKFALIQIYIRIAYYSIENVMKSRSFLFFFVKINNIICLTLKALVVLIIMIYGYSISYLTKERKAKAETEVEKTDIDIYIEINIKFREGLRVFIGGLFMNITTFTLIPTILSIDSPDIFASEHPITSILIPLYTSALIVVVYPIALLGTISSKGGHQDDITMINMFIFSHWHRVEMMPSDSMEAINLTLKSLNKKRVVFPGKQPEDTADIHKHLSPAEDFVSN